MTILAWNGLMLSAQFGVSLLRLSCIGKGRLFSRPLWRFRVFAPMVMPWGSIIGTYTRLKQIIVFGSAYVGGTILTGTSSELPTIIYCAVMVLLYLDDYLTGDDERWDRVKQFFKKKIGLLKVVTG